MKIYVEITTVRGMRSRHWVPILSLGLILLMGFGSSTAPIPSRQGPTDTSIRGFDFGNAIWERHQWLDTLQSFSTSTKVATRRTGEVP